MGVFDSQVKVWSLFHNGGAGPPSEAIVGASQGQVYSTVAGATITVNGATVFIPQNVVWPLPLRSGVTYEVTNVAPNGGELTLLFIG